MCFKKNIFNNDSLVFPGIIYSINRTAERILEHTYLYPGKEQEFTAISEELIVLAAKLESALKGK